MSGDDGVAFACWPSAVENLLRAIISNGLPVLADDNSMRNRLNSVGESVSDPLEKTTFAAGFSASFVGRGVDGLGFLVLVL
jgi:hypothetical protein